MLPYGQSGRPSHPTSQLNKQQDLEDDLEDDDDEEDDDRPLRPNNQAKGGGGGSSSVATAHSHSSRAEVDADAKRQKRLAMNRKAAHESRKRKKLRLEELTRTLNVIAGENKDLRDQNEMLRQPNQYSVRRDVLQGENAQLRMALLSALQDLSKEQSAAVVGGAGEKEASK